MTEVEEREVAEVRRSRSHSHPSHTGRHSNSPSNSCPDSCSRPRVAVEAEVASMEAEGGSTAAEGGSAGR